MVTAGSASVDADAVTQAGSTPRTTRGRSRSAMMPCRAPYWSQTGGKATSRLRIVYATSSRESLPATRSGSRVNTSRATRTAGRSTPVVAACAGPPGGPEQRPAAGAGPSPGQSSCNAFPGKCVPGTNSPPGRGAWPRPGSGAGNDSSVPRGRVTGHRERRVTRRTADRAGPGFSGGCCPVVPRRRCWRTTRTRRRPVAASPARPGPGRSRRPVRL